MSVHFNRIIAGALALIAIAASATSFGQEQPVRVEDWPQFRGPSRNGISRETGWTWHWESGGPKVLWRASVGEGFSSFAVAHGRVYTLGNSNHTDTVFCFEAATGKVLWQHRYPCDAQPLSYEGGPGATPAVDGRCVFTFSKSGDLFCLDAETGKVVWKKKFELWPRHEGDWSNNWRYAGSPLVIGDRLFLGIGQAGIALNKNTGAIIWQSTAGHPGYSSPVPFPTPAGPMLAFFSGHAVFGVEALSGRQLWSVPWQTQWDLNAADPIISAGKMFVSSGNGVGCALFDISATPPRELWRNKNIRNMMNSSVLWKGLLFGFSAEWLSCVAWDTGEEKWRMGGLRKGSLILAGDQLLLLSEKGKLVVAEPSGDAFKPLAEAQVLGGRCWTTPVLSGGRIYVRNAVGEVVCLDVRGPAQSPKNKTP
ncbi:MAG: PQQ-like beta-propeller repeat protein [Verrucomicrobia bacterium]|nr:PQQ-like beta-propeller repeat protein [Verrucomicrobiota bacterium]